jgi:hypothetical protein
VIEKKVPELIHPTNKTDARALKKSIETAYKDQSLDIASQIDQVLKIRNLVAEHPVTAENFDDFQEGLKLRADRLADEFGPGGGAWSLIQELTNIPEFIPPEETRAAKFMLKADVRAYVDAHGVLPERSQVLDMAIERARYIYPEIVGDLPKFGSNEEGRDFQNPNIKLGMRDFPTETVRGYVEHLARSSAESVWDGPIQHRDLPGVALRTYYNGDFQKAMYAIWSNDKLMLSAYGELLAEQMAEVNQTPTTVENRREQTFAKLELFSPGSKLFDYLRDFNGNPTLNGESITEYRRIIADGLNGEPGDLAQLAQKAYVGAQRVEIARQQHRDPALVDIVASPFPDKLVVQLKKEREINWVHVFGSDEKKAFLRNLTDDRLKNKTINADGYALDFETDITRAAFAFDHGQGVKAAERANAEEIKRQLGLISKGNKTVQATLSKLINQNGISLPMTAFGAEAYNPKVDKDGNGPSVMIKESNAFGPRTNFESTYTLISAPNNKVICDLNFMRVGDQLLINGNTICPINRDHKLSGNVSATNYAERHRVSIELDRKDLEKGIIKPKFIIPPTVELHIKPDWGKAATLQKDGQLNDFAA